MQYILRAEQNAENLLHSKSQIHIYKYCYIKYTNSLACGFVLLFCYVQSKTETLIFQTYKIVRAALEKFTKNNYAVNIRHAQAIFPPVDTSNTDIDLSCQFVLRNIFFLPQFFQSVCKFIHSRASCNYFIPNGNKTPDFYQMVIAKYYYRLVRRGVYEEYCKYTKDKTVYR